jgi:hypothetical protein
MVAGIISESRPGSNRNADRHHLGIRNNVTPLGIDACNRAEDKVSAG